MGCPRGGRYVSRGMLAAILAWGCTDGGCGWEDEPPGAFNPLSPSNGQTNVSLTPTLDWEDSSGADSYSLLIDDDPDFSSPVVEEASLTASTYTVAAGILGASTTYYWRVTAENSEGSTPVSNGEFNFTTVPPGSLAWAVRAGGTESDWAYGVAALPDGSALVAGEFMSTATFGLGESNEVTLTSDGSRDIFLARYGPDGTLDWATRAGGTGWDTARGVVALPDGCALLTGSFEATTTFGAGEANETSLTSAGDADIFLARFNPDGTMVWATRAGGTSSDRGLEIAGLPDASALVTGRFSATATFGPGETNETILTSAGKTDILLARYAPDGTLDWAKRAGGTGTDFGFSVAALSDGSALVAGDFEDTTTFGTGEPNETNLSSAGSFDIFLARYSPDGTLDWVRRAGATGADSVRGVAVLSDGSSIIAGLFVETTIFGAGEPNETGLTSAGSSDIFFARYNPDGTLNRAKRAGGMDDDWGWGVAVPSDSSAFVTGRFSTTATFGPGEANEAELTAVGGSDIFLARLDPDGDLAWVKGAGGGGGDFGDGVAVLPDGSVLVIGYFADTVTFGAGEPNETGLTSAGSSDIFLARFNP